MSKFRLNVREILRFYDDDPEARTHSNAVKTLAGEELGIELFRRHLAETNRGPRLLPESCVGEGVRLDGWIEVTHPTKLLYQVEVKSWSMHGYGAAKHRISVDATQEHLAAYKKRLWGHYWESGDFKPTSLKKVLRRMKYPATEVKAVEPVACIWTAVHPRGEENHFFSEPTKSKEFPTVNFFCMSSYLRNILSKGVGEIDLSLPKTATRIGYLQGLFAPVDA